VTIQYPIAVLTYERVKYGGIMGVDKRLYKNWWFAAWTFNDGDSIHLFSLDFQITHNTDNAGVSLGIILFGRQLEVQLYHHEKEVEFDET